MEKEEKFTKTLEMLKLAGLGAVAEEVQSLFKESQDVAPLSITKNRDIMKLMQDLTRLVDMRNAKGEELDRTWAEYKDQQIKYEVFNTQIKEMWATIDETIVKLTTAK